MTNLKKVALCIVMIVIVSLGCTMTLVASIGVGPWDALAQTGSSITGIKVGSVGMICNFICIGIQLLMLRKNFKIKNALQIAMTVVIGYGVNFFFYQVFGGVQLTSYASRILMMIGGIVLSAFSDAVIMLLDVVTFPLEGACKVICDRTGWKLSVLRQVVDVICIAIVLAATFIFNVSSSIREGTIISMLIFGPLFGIFMKCLRPAMLRKQMLAENNR